MRRRYARKRAVLVEALQTVVPQVTVTGPAGGLHLLAHLSAGMSERDTAVRARSLGVGLHELHRHCTGTAPRWRRHRRLCCSVMPSRASLTSSRRPG